MLNSPTIAIVVVTYKRQELLKTLFDSFRALTQQPTYVVIVDNEAAEATESLAITLKQDLPMTQVRYVPMEENTGGAGGFSKGVEVAYQLGADWLWLMDDDVKIFPDSVEKLIPWLEKGSKNNQLAIQIGRKNFDGSDFYWQYDFNTKLGIPNPIAPAAFKPDESYRKINTMCFEGGLFSRQLVEKIGLPDSRFFIYWDDTMYGYLASKVTQPILINEIFMARTRTLEHVNLGKIRKLNATSDMVRYYIMRNRGYMAQYFKIYGDYKPLIFSFGTFLTLTKESIRLLSLSNKRRQSLKELWRGTKDAKKLRKDKNWQAMPKLK